MGQVGQVRYSIFTALIWVFRKKERESKKTWTNNSMHFALWHRNISKILVLWLSEPLSSLSTFSVLIWTAVHKHSTSVFGRNLSLWKHTLLRTIIFIKETRYTLDFPPFFYKGDNFCDLLFMFLYMNPLLKRAFSERKEFTLLWSKFFPF